MQPLWRFDLLLLLLPLLTVRHAAVESFDSERLWWQGEARRAVCCSLSVRWLFDEGRGAHRGTSPLLIIPLYSRYIERLRCRSLRWSASSLRSNKLSNRPTTQLTSLFLTSQRTKRSKATQRNNISAETTETPLVSSTQLSITLRQRPKSFV